MPVARNNPSPQEQQAARARRISWTVGLALLAGIAGGVLWAPSARGSTIAAHIAVVCFGTGTIVFASYPLTALVILPRTFRRVLRSRREDESPSSRQSKPGHENATNDSR